MPIYAKAMSSVAMYAMTYSYCVTNSTCEYRMPFKEISKHKGRDSVGEENAPTDMCTKNIFK